MSKTDLQLRRNLNKPTKRLLEAFSKLFPPLDLLDLSNGSIWPLGTLSEFKISFTIEPVDFLD